MTRTKLKLGTFPSLYGFVFVGEGGKNTRSLRIIAHRFFAQPEQQLALSHMAGGAVLTPAQLLEQQKKANATMIEMEERRLEKMQRRQV